jgi:hypothetical protein
MGVEQHTHAHGTSFARDKAMDIISRIDKVAGVFTSAHGRRAQYLYLGESEIRELNEYVESIRVAPSPLGTGAKVGGLYIFAVISPSHIAVS